MESKCSTVTDLRAYLEQTYAKNCCVEFSHVTDAKERSWLHENFEAYMNDTEGVGKVTAGEKIKAL